MLGIQSFDTTLHCACSSENTTCVHALVEEVEVLGIQSCVHALVEEEVDVLGIQSCVHALVKKKLRYWEFRAVFVHLWRKKLRCWGCWESGAVFVH